VFHEKFCKKLRETSSKNRAKATLVIEAAFRFLPETIQGVLRLAKHPDSVRGHWRGQGG
jgi:hypothetical protein